MNGIIILLNWSSHSESFHWILVQSWRPSFHETFHVIYTCYERPWFVLRDHNLVFPTCRVVIEARFDCSPHGLYIIVRPYMLCCSYWIDSRFQLCIESNTYGQVHDMYSTKYTHTKLYNYVPVNFKKLSFTLGWVKKKNWFNYDGVEFTL